MLAYRSRRHVRHVRHLSSALSSCRHHHPASAQSCLVWRCTCSHWFSPSLPSSSCIVLVFLVHVPWSRYAIQYLPHVTLTRLDRDAVATPLADTIQGSSSLLEVRIFNNHLLIDFVFSWYHFDEEFHCRSFPTNRDVVPCARFRRHVHP